MSNDMRMYLIEFVDGNAEISDFICVKAENEQKAIDLFNDKKFKQWKFIGIKHIWCIE